MTDIEDVLSRVSCPDLCEELGIELDAHGRTPCFHDGLDAHQNRSVDVDERVWYCHRCGKGGTVIDLLMQATGCSYYAARMKLEDFGENKPARIEKAEPKPAIIFGAADLGNGTFTPAHEEFRRRRYGSINWDTAHNVFPVVNGFAFCYPALPALSGWEGVKFRHFDGGKSSLPGSRFSRLWRARGGAGGAVICEGETDALAMACYIDSNPYRGGNCAVYSLPSGAGNVKAEFFDELSKFDKVWICMDNDDAGRKCDVKIHRSSQYRFDTLRLPGLYNDAEEALRNGWDPKLV